MDDFIGILRAAQGGDRKAMTSIINRFGNDVRAECFEFDLAGKGDIGIADLYQEAWLQIWLKIDRFDGVADREICFKMFRRWLRRSTRNSIINLISRQRALKRSPTGRLASIDGTNSEGTETASIPDGEGETPSRIAVNNEQVAKLRLAVQQLPNECRAMIVSCFFDGVSVPDAAKRLGLSYDQARKRLGIAIKQLNKILNDETID